MIRIDPAGAAQARFPFRPQPDPAPPDPGGDGMPPWLAERLFDRRIVMLRGPLTGPAASQAAAALLTLDALGSEPVELHLSVVDGELAAAFALVDAVEAMRAPVHAVVPAQVGGAGMAVLVAAARRAAHRHARLRLSEPLARGAGGTADQVAAAAGEHLRELDELVVRLVAVTGQARSRIEDDLSSGRVLSAEQAQEYGLLDEIIGARPAA
jgi:ATP-dependent Clp protease, protease subunit